MFGKEIVNTPPTSRREFCREIAAMFATAATANSGLVRGFARSAEKVNVAEVDRKRILAAAQRYIKEEPITMVAYSSRRSAGGKHDYFSEADYWWPDPKDPNGRYIQRDGMSNPDNFVAHRHAMIRLSLQVPALTAAWMLTKNERYAAHAAKHLRAWFLDPATLMNPNLQYAQAIHGRTTGRGTGIIDTIHLVEVARSIPVLGSSKALTGAEQEALKKWFADYLQWITTSKNGQEERDARNNHGTCWVMQAAEFARYTGNREQTEYCRNRVKTVLFPDQVAADGSFPQELRRTKPYNYCLFNLDTLATSCQILSTPADNLWTYKLPDGRGMEKVMAFMYPFIADKKRWPYPRDVEYFDQFPLRQPSLLFAGLALSRPEYIATWERLNPDPTVEEAIRNYPIRQPALWV